MMKRVNITIDEETLRSLDVIGEEYGMSRSEAIRFMVEAMDEMQAWDRLQEVGKQLFCERYGRDTEGAHVSPSMMLKAAAKCTVDRY